MRENEIRPANILAEYLRLSAADGERYFRDRSSLVFRSCPGCDANEPNLSFEKHGFEFVRCGVCDSLYVTPCPTAEQLIPLYNESESSRYWAEVFFPTVTEIRRAKIFAPRARRLIGIMEEMKQPFTSVTEVGAGAGVFLEEIRRIRPDALIRAVEPGEALARQCRQKGFETFEGVVEKSVQDRKWAGSADIVVCFEVIEHTADTPSFVSALRALAKPGGIVLFSGLSGDGFDIRALGQASNAVSPPHHLTFLSVAGARRLIERSGLEVIDVFTPGELDVDIVVNALKKDDSIVRDPFLRSILLCPDKFVRSAFQDFLRENHLSSHMWGLGRRQPTRIK